MEKLLLYLESIYPMSDGLKDHLVAILKAKELSKKTYLLRAGHVCRNIYFINTGLLRCFYLKDDHEVSSWFMKEGNVIISIESFYEQKQSYESIQALEDCFLYYIEYTELQSIYRNFLEFNYIARLLTERYYTLWAQQLYGLRMQQAQERYNWLLEKFPELVQRVPAKYIASYLGITDVRLSNIKGRK